MATIVTTGAGREIWMGFEVPGADVDLSEFDLIRADAMTDEEVASCGVTNWVVVPSVEVLLSRVITWH